MKVYRGQRTSWNPRVTVTEGDQTWTLRHEERHSPNGFDWGQRDRGVWGGGIRRGGAADLALALLLTVTDRRTAEAHYQDFAYEVLERLPRHDGWEMAESEISGWLAARQPSGAYGAAHR